MLASLQVWAKPLDAGALAPARSGAPPVLRDPLNVILVLLAASGLTELVLQRVVYRIGVHIPRSGAFLDVYQAATWAGDYAFRLTAVLLVLAAGTLVLRLWSTPRFVTGAFVGVLLGANALAWPLDNHLGAQISALVMPLATGWVLAEVLFERAQSTFKAGVLVLGTVLLLGQYETAREAYELPASGVGGVHLLMELGILSGALLLGVAAAGGQLSFKRALIPGFFCLLVAASFIREPSTVAIVSLWATGVSMSLPGLLYIAAFGAISLAAYSWFLRPETRHWGIAVALLFVAGIQPQVLHHEITALLALTMLSIGVESPQAPSLERGK